jgi:hypothetical protein
MGESDGNSVESGRSVKPRIIRSVLLRLFVWRGRSRDRLLPGSQPISVSKLVTSLVKLRYVQPKVRCLNAYRTSVLSVNRPKDALTVFVRGSASLWGIDESESSNLFKYPGTILVSVERYIPALSLPNKTTEKLSKLHSNHILWGDFTLLQ